jgi:protein-L-isoaspartate O-methyltransferase
MLLAALPMRIPPKKSLGQNFLTDLHYLGKIVDAAKVGPDDQVVEIGPGLSWTTALSRDCAGSSPPADRSKSSTEMR